MRQFVLASIAAVAATSASAQQCAVPAAEAFGTVPSQADRNEPNSAAVVRAQTPPDLKDNPVLRQVTAAGALLVDMGQFRGLRVVGARSGQEFRVFSLLPDGSGAIEGAPLALTVAQLNDLAGPSIVSLGRAIGVDGLFVRSGQQFQVFYALPDGGAVVPGILRDAYGHNLTRDQVKNVPGAIPTVDLQAETAGQGSQASPEAALSAVQKTSYGSVGQAGAPEVFMMVDPQCIYSIRAFQQLQPYAAAGKIKLSLVPVSILDHEDQGRSTKSALALLAKPPADIAVAWQRGETNGAATADAQARLSSNMATATAVGLTGTPTLFWRGQDGRAMRIDGVPTDIGALIASAGG